MLGILIEQQEEQLGGTVRGGGRRGKERVREVCTADHVFYSTA